MKTRGTHTGAEFGKLPTDEPGEDAETKAPGRTGDRRSLKVDRSPDSGLPKTRVREHDRRDPDVCLPPEGAVGETPLAGRERARKERRRTHP